MIALTTYVGRAGDRNARAMRGASILGEALAKRTGLRPRRIGTPGQPIAGGWAAQLEAAFPISNGLAPASAKSWIAARGR